MTSPRLTRRALEKDFAAYGYILNTHPVTRRYYVIDARHYSASWHDFAFPIANFGELAEAEAWLARRPDSEKTDWKSIPEAVTRLMPILARGTKLEVML